MAPVQFLAELTTEPLVLRLPAKHTRILNRSQSVNLPWVQYTKRIGHVKYQIQSPSERVSYFSPLLSTFWQSGQKKINSLNLFTPTACLCLWSHFAGCLGGILGLGCFIGYQTIVGFCLPVNPFLTVFNRVSLASNLGNSAVNHTKTIVFT